MDIKALFDEAILEINTHVRATKQLQDSFISSMTSILSSINMEIKTLENEIAKLKETK